MLLSPVTLLIDIVESEKQRVLDTSGALMPDNNGNLIMVYDTMRSILNPSCTLVATRPSRLGSSTMPGSSSGFSISFFAGLYHALSEQ